MPCADARVRSGTGAKSCSFLYAQGSASRRKPVDTAHHTGQMNRTVYRRAPGLVPDPPHNLRPVDDQDDAALADLMERAYAGTMDEHLGGNSDGAV